MKKVFLVFTILLLFSLVSSECLNGQVDINSASLEDLKKFTGIGDTKAQAIIDHRINTPFKTLEELKEIKGIGQATLDKMKQEGACVSNSIPEETQDLEDEIQTILETSQTQNISKGSNDYKTEDTKEKTILKINLNTATEKELEELIGVGTTTAQEIIKKRPFCSLEDLLNVKGIGQTTFEKIKNQDLAYVESCEQQSLIETEEENYIEEKPTNIEISVSKKQDQTTENIIKLNNQEKAIIGKVIYQSKTEKIRKGAIPIFFVLLLIIILLIIKK